MTSLKGSLPPPGSASWSASRATPAVEEDPLSEELRVRHVVIREAISRVLPTKHTVYKIHVMTQTEQWSILRRFREFESLHGKLFKLHLVKKDALPNKRVLGNFDKENIEKRREGLEQYLQRLITSESDSVLFAKPFLDFLDVPSHHVLHVTHKLTREMAQNGDSLLSKNAPYHLTAIQCRCIDQRLKLPYNYKHKGDWNDGTFSRQSPDAMVIGSQDDLANLYEFVYRLKHLCIHPVREPFVTSEDALIESTEVDLTIWRSLQKLEIDHCVFAHFLGLGAVQENVTHLRVRYANVSKMKEVLLDAVVEKRKAPQNQSTNVDSWRKTAMASLSDRIYVKPWIRLQKLDLSCNDIEEVEASVLELLPVLDALDLHSNRISSLKSWLTAGIPHKIKSLNLSHNCIDTLKCERNSQQTSKITLSALEMERPPRKMTTIDPSWIGSLSEAPVALTPKVPTPLNMPPPSYNSHHLISTQNPNATLDELQRLRMQSPQNGSEEIRTVTANRVLQDTVQRAQTETRAIYETDDVSSNTAPQRSQTQIDASITVFSIAMLSPNLTELHLANNALTSLKGLERIPELTTLDVSHNKLAKFSDISTLMSVNKLHTLHIKGNPIIQSKDYRAKLLARIKSPNQKIQVDGAQVSDDAVRAAQAQMRNGNAK
eukprot:m.57607 g.57607  ORF g.57607 m.57607 type:complete len:659 (+) comp11119_c0_seq1:3005-4981(+)